MDKYTQRILDKFLKDLPIWQQKLRFDNGKMEKVYCSHLTKQARKWRKLALLYRRLHY